MTYYFSLGLRAHLGEVDSVVTPQWVKDRNVFLESLHVAAMRCPASCGSACPNHHCLAHTEDEKYKPSSIAIRARGEQA
jgi:hypothetical protein